ncbi:MAG TPA: hypothetical protein VF269_03425 [Rhodanobacteraceae bacterium]
MSIRPDPITRCRLAWRRLTTCWLLAGTALLLLTPLHAWTPLLGWAPLLMLVVTPMLMRLTLEPTWLLSILTACLRMRPRRRRLAGAVWRG